MMGGSILLFQDAINSASSITRTLSGELADGQRKLMAIAAAGAGSSIANPLLTQLSNGPLAGIHEMVHFFRPLQMIILNVVSRPFSVHS